jgi:hypothetical protein
MSMYYLHRAGATTGPYTPVRLGIMVDAGEIAATDQVCEIGKTEWMPVEFVLPVSEPVLKQKAVVMPRVARSPYVWLALFIFVMGILTMIMIPWIIGVPAGILLIVISLIVDRRHHICGGCGNRVEKTSMVCPACHAKLVKRLPKK